MMQCLFYKKLPKLKILNTQPRKSAEQKCYFGGPLPHITFCPTGGISLATAPNYLALNNVICVGGTWMLDKQLIENKDWQAIEALARQASELK